MKIFPSLASADPLCLGAEIERLGKCPQLHFDLEDGNFVPNITFGFKTIRAARAVTKAAFDAHLMVGDPLSYIEPLATLHFRAVAFHWETADYPSRIIAAIRARQMKAGAALNPRTNAEALALFIGQLDYVLVMTAEPDGRGDLFQPSMLHKIKQLRTMHPTIDIICDGGLGDAELKLIQSVGATGAVVGRAIFNATEPQAKIREWKKSCISI